MHWPYILELSSDNFLRFFQNFSKDDYNHLWIKIILLLPLKCGCLLFLLLAWLPWLELSVQCWKPQYSGNSKHPSLIPDAPKQTNVSLLSMMWIRGFCGFLLFLLFRDYLSGVVAGFYKKEKNASLEIMWFLL
jgi:hypothetical protein